MYAIEIGETIISNSIRKDKSNNVLRGEVLSDVLIKIDQIIGCLEDFKGNYHKKFNYTKLIGMLDLSEFESREILSLIFKVQDVLNRTFEGHYIEQKKENGTVYLTTHKKPDKIENVLPDKIMISKAHREILNDIIYLFQKVDGGKGFDIKTINTPLINKFNKLKKAHPYFFKNGNDKVYPSELGQRLGEFILRNNKLNKNLNTTEIDNIKIIFEEK